MCGTPPVLSVGDMQSTATEVHDLHKSHDGQLGDRGSIPSHGGETLQRNGRAHDQDTTVVALSERRRRPAGGW